METAGTTSVSAAVPASGPTVKSGTAIMAGFTMLIEAVMLTAMVFIFHNLPLNKNYLEPNVVAGKKWAWLWLTLYYMVAVLLTIWIYRFLVIPIIMKALPPYLTWYTQQTGKLYKKKPE
jgi:hypothetical protein